MEDTTMVLLLLGALVLGYYAKDLIGPVCGIADTVVDELEDDELVLERSLKKQQTQQMLLLGGIVLLGVCFMMTQTGQKGGNGNDGEGEGDGDGDGRRPPKSNSSWIETAKDILLGVKAGVYVVVIIIVALIFFKMYAAI